MTAPQSSSSASDELRSCPFCGGEPQFVCGGPGNWYVRCLACGAASDDLMRHVAIERWNTRSSPAPQIAGGVREAIEQCAKIAETVYSRMFPKPSNRITAENAGHVAAAAIRSLSPQAQAGETYSGQTATNLGATIEVVGAVSGVAQRPADSGEPVAWQYKHESNGDDGWCMLKAGDDPTEFLKQWPSIKYDVRPLYASPPAPLQAGTWQPIETANERIREFAKMRQHTIPLGPVVQLGGSLEDGSLYLFGHHALTHEVQQWIVIPALYCRPMDALSLPSTEGK